MAKQISELNWIKRLLLVSYKNEDEKIFNESKKFISDNKCQIDDRNLEILFFKNFKNKYYSTPDFIENKRFSTLLSRKANLKEVNQIVSEWTCKFSKKELSNKLGGIVPFGPVNNIEEIINDPHTIKRKMISKVTKPDNPSESWFVASNPLNFNLSQKPQSQCFVI